MATDTTDDLQVCFAILRRAVRGKPVAEAALQVMMQHAMAAQQQQADADRDSIDAYLSARCVTQMDARVPSAALYADYLTWCTERGAAPHSQRRFGQQLDTHGFARVRGRQGTWYRVGIRLYAQQEAPHGD